MPHSYGYRARTRKIFAQPFRKSGPVPLSKYLTTYRLGDYVDIKVNGSVHKGMPHRFYHGKTGVVWNVTKHAIGVEVSKTVRNRIIKKRIHVRVEHVQPSRCREDFLNRVKKNAELKKQAKKDKSMCNLFWFILYLIFVPFPERVSLKRQPAQPAPGKLVKAKLRDAIFVTPQKYEFLL
jgi:large subunit ribosomal protein L21e